MDMNINGISVSVPEEVISEYPYLTFIVSESSHESFTGREYTRTAYLIASKAELLYVPAALMQAAYGVYYNTIGSLVAGYNVNSYSFKNASWSGFSSTPSTQQPLLPISMYGSPVWTNYDIRKVTGQSADGSLTLGDVYFANSYTDYSEEYKVTAPWLVGVANQVRRLYGIQGMGSLTTDMMLTAFEELPDPSNADWMTSSTFDYETKEFYSDANVIYAPTAFSLKADVKKINLPYATEIRTEKIVNSTIINKGWTYCSLFSNCESITSINAPLLEVTGVQAFNGCSGLTSVNFPKLKEVMHYVFENCTNLARADFGVATAIGNIAFGGCTKLETLILRSKRVVEYDVNGIGIPSDSPIGAGTGYIYVPSAYVDSYKADSKWSAFSNQIRAIEDYPDICGTTA